MLLSNIVVVDVVEDAMRVGDKLEGLCAKRDAFFKLDEGRREKRPLCEKKDGQKNGDQKMHLSLIGSGGCFCKVVVSDCRAIGCGAEIWMFLF